MLPYKTILIRIVNRIFIFLITYLRPFLGPAQCRFYESCTPYAIRQLKEKPFYTAIPRIIKRLIYCSPFKNMFLQ